MIIIPDIHGRTFWKEAVKDNDTEEVVFLGDYLDPYPKEGISKEDALANFKEILQYKRQNYDRVTLLLGNHDIAYIDSVAMVTRHDFEHEKEIEALFADNADCFKLCTSTTIDGRCFLLSHALLSKYWLDILCQHLNIDSPEPENIADCINQAYIAQPEKTLELLRIVSHYRGGELPIGSIVWADVRETALQGNLITGVYNIFGHTQIGKALIDEHFACIDTHEAYKLALFDDAEEVCKVYSKTIVPLSKAAQSLLPKSPL